MAGEHEQFTNLSLEARGALAAAELDELKKKINAGTWNDYLERLLSSWGEKAAGLSFMHNEASSYWTTHGNYLTMMSIVVSTIASGVSLIAAGISDVDAKNGVMYGVGAVGLISSTIQAFKKFYNSEEKAADHGVSSKQFGGFYRFMTLQLGLPRTDRMPADRLSEYVLKEYERMQQDARPLSDREINIFKSKFKNAEQSVPDICEDDFIINVYGSPPTLHELQEARKVQTVSAS